MNENVEGGGASRTTDPAAGSSAATDVSLREFEGVGRHKDIERLNERFAWLVGFGVFAWFQIQKHLALVNNENDRLAKFLEGTVSADTYRANEGQRRSEALKLDSWQRDVEKVTQHAVTRDELDDKSRMRSRSNFGLSIQAVLAVVAVVVMITAVLTYIAVHHH